MRHGLSDPLPPRFAPGGSPTLQGGETFVPLAKGGRPPRSASPIGRSIKEGGRGSLTHNVLVCMVFVLFALPLAAQTPQNSSVLGQVGIDQNLGATVDLNLVFRDEAGKAVRLGEFFHGRPVILAPVYFGCPSLCPMSLNSLVQSLRVLKFNAGEDFEVIAFSFDPKETPAMAAEARMHYLRDYNRPHTANGWHFLTGDESSIRALTGSIGFHYAWDNDSAQWAHATAIVVATPEGKLSQYFYGLEFSARDLRLSLVEASSEKIGSLADRVLLYCYHYDPATGKYGIVIIRSIRIAGTLTALALFTFMFVMFKREGKTRDA
jgi:protein SCO1/2